MAQDSNLFSQPVVSVYTGPDRTAMPITIDNDKSVKLFLTGFNGQAQVNYQLNYAFSNDAFVYIFGERLALIGITGLGFSGKVCEGKSDTTQYSPQEFLKFYNKYKLKIDNPTPITFTAGGMVFQGYFVSLAIQLVNEREDFYQFTFTLLGRVNTYGEGLLPSDRSR